MDHKLATDSMAVEKYLLGEMNSDERTLFEKHAFDCDECAGAIRDGITLLDNGRELVAVDGHVLVPVPGKFGWKAHMNRLMPVAAAVLAAVVGVQNIVTIPALRQAATVPMLQIPMSFNADQARGPADDQPRAGQPSLHYFNVTSEDKFKSYRCVLFDAAGRELRSMPVTEKQTTQTIPVLLGPLPAGSYVLVIEGVREDGNRIPVTTRESIKVQGP